MKRALSNIVLIIALVFLTSCVITPETPPYIITTPVFEMQGASYDFFYAGISFYFLNKTAKDIKSITVIFTLFDEKPQAYLFSGSNIFEITKVSQIKPEENKKIVLSLDKFFYIAPAEPYLIDLFYVSEIAYTDGSKWNDKYGAYRVWR